MAIQVIEVEIPGLPGASGGLARSYNLYVDSAGDDNNSGLLPLYPFATVHAAQAHIASLTSIDNWTINVKGHHNYTSPVTAFFRAAFVDILGEFDDTTCSGASVLSGSAGSWLVKYTLADASTVAIGDWLIIRDAVGTGLYKILQGCWEVQSISGSDVTVRHSGMLDPFPTGTIISANVSVIHTVLKFAGCDGLRAYSSFQADGVAIVGDYTAGAIGVVTNRQAISNIENSVSVGLWNKHVCISRFNIGALGQYGSTIDFFSGAVSDCLVYNVLGQHTGSVFFNSGVSIGCLEVGVAATDSGNVSGEESSSCGNGTYGYWEYNKGSVLAKGASAWSNVKAGLRSTYGGGARTGTAFGFSSKDNDIGLEAIGGGSIYCEGNSILNNRTIGIKSVDLSQVYAKGSVVTGNGAQDLSSAHMGFIDLDGGTANKVHAESGGANNINQVSGLTSVTPALNRVLSDGTRNYDGNFITDRWPDSWVVPAGLNVSTFEGSIGTATAIGAADTIYAYPFEIKFPIIVKAINFRVVTGGAGSSIKAAIYAAKITSAGPRPYGVPLVFNNTGASTASSSSTASLPVSTITLNPGMYCVAKKLTGTMPVLVHIATNSWRLNTILGRTNLSTTALQGLSLSSPFADDMPTLNGTETWAEVTTGAIGIGHLGT